MAEANRFHDDKSTYTGVYKAGGPSHMDNNITLEMLADRSNTGTIRGVPDRPDGYFTSAHSGVGSLQEKPRDGKEIINETPMYNRSPGELPPTPQETTRSPPKAPEHSHASRKTRTSMHLQNMKSGSQKSLSPRGSGGAPKR